MGYGSDSDLTVQKVNSDLVEMWKETKMANSRWYSHIYMDSGGRQPILEQVSPQYKSHTLFLSNNDRQECS